MRKLKTILAIATLTTFSVFAGTFQTINFNQKTHSDTDPFGVQALATVRGKVESIENGLTSNIQTEVKKQLTNSTDVVIGQVIGTSDDIGLVARNKSIVMAVNRDIGELNVEEGSITFAADKIQLGPLDSIYIGNKSLSDLLSTAGGENGDKNVIEEIQVNGVKVEPQNKAVNITVPSTNGLAVASEVDSTYAKKSEIPSIEGLASKQYVDDEMTNYVKLADLQEGIEVDTIEARSLKIDGQDVSLVGHKHGASDITNLSEVISTQISGLASEKFVTNKMSEYVKKSDVSSSAQTAITGINDATTIEEIKVALTNFLQTLVIPAQ